MSTASSRPTGRRILGFGGLGYVMRKFDFEPAPMVLAFVLGRMAEESFRQALLMSRGNLEILLVRPLATVFVAAATVVMLAPLVAPPIRRMLRTVPLEEAN